jgi:transposase
MSSAQTRGAASPSITIARAEYEALQAQVHSLKTQHDCFKRQLFGTTSEKQRLIDPAVQGNLLTGLGVAPAVAPCAIPTEMVTYQRKKLREMCLTDTGLRFDATVPLHDILGDPAIERLPESARELIGEKVSYRLAQRPAGYEVIKYIQRVYKLRESGEIRSTPTPPAVLEKCVADVSLLAGPLVDKFQYHLPLYRQHQRLEAAGFRLSRGSLTNWSARAIDLLAPIFEAQCAQVRASRVVAMDDDCRDAGGRAIGIGRSLAAPPSHTTGHTDHVSGGSMN